MVWSSNSLGCLVTEKDTTPWFQLCSGRLAPRRPHLGTRCIGWILEQGGLFSSPNTRKPFVGFKPSGPTRTKRTTPGWFIAFRRLRESCSSLSRARRQGRISRALGTGLGGFTEKLASSSGRLNLDAPTKSEGTHRPWVIPSLGTPCMQLRPFTQVTGFTWSARNCAGLTPTRESNKS